MGRIKEKERGVLEMNIKRRKRRSRGGSHASKKGKKELSCWRGADAKEEKGTWGLELLK